MRIVRSETIPVCDLPRPSPIRGGHVHGSVASGEDDDIELPIVEQVAPVVPSAAAQRAGFTQLDQWDVDDIFSRRASDEDRVTFPVGVFPHRFESGH